MSDFEKSFENISITRQVPIINGFAQLPEALEKNKTTLTADSLLSSEDDAELNTVVARTGSARSAGGKHGIQEWIELCDQPLQGSCDTAESAKELIDNSTTPSYDKPPRGEGQWNDSSSG